KQRTPRDRRVIKAASISFSLPACKIRIYHRTAWYHRAPWRPSQLHAMPRRQGNGRLHSDRRAARSLHLQPSASGGVDELGRGQSLSATKEGRLIAIFAQGRLGTIMKSFI